MAFYPEFSGVALQARNEALRKIIEKAERSIGPDIVVRSLRPADLQFGGSTYVLFQSGTTLSTLRNAVTIADDTYISVYGFTLAMNNNTGAAGTVSDLERVRWTRKGSVARDWDVTAIPRWQHQTGWVDDPITLDPNTSLTIETQSAVGSTLAQGAYAFHGDVVERRGITINP